MSSSKVEVQKDDKSDKKKTMSNRFKSLLQKSNTDKSSLYSRNSMHESDSESQKSQASLKSKHYSLGSLTNKNGINTDELLNSLPDVNKAQSIEYKSKLINNWLDNLNLVEEPGSRVQSMNDNDRGLSLDDLDWLDKDTPTRSRPNTPLEELDKRLTNKASNLSKEITLNNKTLRPSSSINSLANVNEASAEASEGIKVNNFVGDEFLKTASEDSLDDPNIDDSNGSFKADLSNNELLLEPAQRKRNYDFHLIFPSLGLDDILVDDFMCALQKEILISGRMYISTEHVCFHSSLFGWTTNMIVPFKDIIKIEKKSTAFVIPNAIQINTLENKYFFASFMARDQVFSMLSEFWVKKCPTRVVFQDQKTNKKAKVNGGSPKMENFADADPEDGDGSLQSKTTKCSCFLAGGVGHPGVISCDIILPTTIQTAFNILFSSKSPEFLKELYETSNNSEINIEEWDTVPDEKNVEPPEKCIRNVTFIKALTNPLGPKQTKCIGVDELIYKDLSNSVTVINTCKNPDVPSGSCFAVVVRYCLTINKTNQTRLVMSTVIEWYKSSWIKGPIESGSKDGVKEAGEHLNNKIGEYLVKNPELKTEPLNTSANEEVVQSEPENIVEIKDQPIESNWFSTIKAWIPFFDRESNDNTDRHGGMLNPMLVLMFALTFTNIWSWVTISKLKASKSKIEDQSKKSSKTKIDNIDVLPQLKLMEDQIKVLYENMKKLKEEVVKKSPFKFGSEDKD